MMKKCLHTAWKRRILVLLLLITALVSGYAQEPSTFQLFDSEGREIRFTKALNAMSKADVVFFGELHNDPISHWLERRVLKGLYEKDPRLALAMEMFEADDQLPLTEYIRGTIEERHFLKEVKMWDNYSTDYKPLVEFAKAKKLDVIASNVPRRYANLVYRKGISSLDSLPATAKEVIAPLPIAVDLELACYKNMIASMGGHAAVGTAENMARSQAVKDATMAHFILKHNNTRVFHVNGAYHSQNGEGIIWHLKRSKPGISVATIQVVEQESTDNLDDKNKHLADYIVVVPKDMTKTY
jgi:uncharacterized iron-regulated protein